MRSSVVKRSVVVGKHKTSVSLEDEFWTGVKEIAASRRTTCSALLNELNEHRQSGNLSSAIRQFVLHHYQERARQSEHPVHLRKLRSTFAQPALSRRAYHPRCEGAWWSTGRAPGSGGKREAGDVGCFQQDKSPPFCESQQVA
jgi:predicted DNA-binding ribbon-helix-helix protein